MDYSQIMSSFIINEQTSREAADNRVSGTSERCFRIYNKSHTFDCSLNNVLQIKIFKTLN